MKLSKIALASLLAVGTASSFAQVACDSTNALTFTNTCAPEMTVYIAGASALSDAVKAVVPTYFDTTKPFTTILDGGSTNGFKANDFNLIGTAKTKTGPNSVIGWYGTSLATEAFGNAQKRLFVVYNNFNGSAAGVSQVLAKALVDAKGAVAGTATNTALTTIPEAKVVTVGPTGASTPNTCVAYDGTALTLTSTTVRIDGATADLTKPTSTSANQIICSSNAVTKADLAISDVDVTDLVEIYSSVAKAPVTAITRKPIGMQGFAIAVNNNFYNALQTAQKTAGKLSTACSTGEYTEACQPNVSRAQYASLASKSGNLKSSGAFIPGDATFLTLARRDQMSGTQASSEMFFMGSKCANPAALSAMRPSDADGYVSMGVTENAQTANVEDQLTAATGYSIGVISLSKGASTTYKFVKMDGSSPNFTRNGTSPLSSADDMRKNMIDGTWPFQVTSYMMALTKDLSVKTNTKAPILNQMLTDFTSGTGTHNLKAVSYFDGPANKKSLVTRQYMKGTGAKAVNTLSNCAPLVAGQ